MTAKQCYEAILIELNKENAPNILLEDFNYLFNKAINLYVNKRYNIYDINQQTTDDLRVLKATALISPNKCNRYGDFTDIGRMMGATYELILPSDYLHILNCICIYEVKKTFKCYNRGDIWRSAATKLTADAYSRVLDNFWLRPTYRRPYYYIHNVNIPINSDTVPTAPRTLINEASGNKYFVGKIDTNVLERIKSSAEDLLEFMSDKLDNIAGIHNISDPMDFVYFIAPSNKSFTVYQPGKLGTVDIQNEAELGGYRIMRTVLPSHGDCEIDAEIESTKRVEIGTDFLKDGYSTKYPYGNAGNLYDGELGKDEFGNEIFNIAKGKGVRNSTNIDLGNGEYRQGSSIERSALVRYGNASSVRMEIRYGSDDSLFKLKNVYIDYIKVPLTIRLTQEQLDLTADTSQMLEFPDYVCQEIINELVHLIMENISDLRLQTHPVVSLSIANPAQQLTESVAQLS